MIIILKNTYSDTYNNIFSYMISLFIYICMCAYVYVCMYVCVCMCV